LPRHEKDRNDAAPELCHQSGFVVSKTFCFSRRHLAGASGWLVSRATGLRAWRFEVSRPAIHAKPA
jgi:hypothetical protein